jgi:hypothetical protein
VGEITGMSDPVHTNFNPAPAAAAKPVAERRTRSFYLGSGPFEILSVVLFMAVIFAALLLPLVHWVRTLIRGF